MKLYTIGTGHRPHYDFTRILFKFGIQVLFDLRSRPNAATDNLAHFSRAGLERLCAENKINYIYLGNELGAPRASTFKDWVKSEEFHRGVKIITSKIPTSVCCLLCSCFLPKYCHRLIIANEIARSGVEVVHILEERRFWYPPRRSPREK